jgi:hypothetical protein
VSASYTAFSALQRLARVHVRNCGVLQLRRAGWHRAAETVCSSSSSSSNSSSTPCISACTYMVRSVRARVGAVVAVPVAAVPVL